MECDHLTLEQQDRALIARAVADSTRVYLAPMDKGLSGSAVWQARWRLQSGHLSKLHVFKIGPTRKLEAEEKAIVDIASVIEQGFPLAVLYRSEDCNRSLLRQEFAGDPSGTTFSLRNYIRMPLYNATPETLAEVIDRLYSVRMRAWHYGNDPCRRQLSIDEAVPWWRPKINLTKIANDIGFAELNSELKAKHDITIPEMSARVEEILHQNHPLCVGPVHGDLHATNVNLDEKLNVYLIDYGNTMYTWRAVDFIILEAAIKFATTPAHAPLDSLIQCERLIDQGAKTSTLPAGALYGDELRKTLASCVVIRRHCAESGAEVDLARYRAGLICVCAAFTSIEWMVNRRFLFHSIAYHLKKLDGAHE